MAKTFYRHRARAKKVGIQIATFPQMIADLGHSRRGANRIFHNHLKEKGHSPNVIQKEKAYMLMKFDQHNAEKLKKGVKDRI